MTTSLDSPLLRPLQPQDEPAVLDLLETALAGGPTGSRTADFLRWKHFDNPFGRSIGLVAEDEGAVVGVRMIMRWAFEAAGQHVTAGRMVDTATHPSHQGRGIFKALTGASLELVRQDTDLIFNTPNGNSRPGYLKMGWQVVGTVPTSFLAVRPLRLARGAKQALRRETSTRRGIDFDCPLPSVEEVLDTHVDDVCALLEARREAAAGRLTTRAELPYLRWRYVDPPGLDYRAIPVLREGRLIGLGIGRLRRRGDLLEFTLAEVLADRSHPGAAATVLRRARHSGADHVATHVARRTPASRGLLKAGYLTTRRVGLTLTALPLRTLPADPLAESTWSLSLGDLEVF